MLIRFAALGALVLAASGTIGCSSTREVKTQAYAVLKSHRTYEYEFPVVWKGIEKAVSGLKVTDRDPEEVDPVEMRKLDRRTLETDWVYGQSRDKYVEYKVNDSPRKKYLQTRTRYKVDARSQIGGVDVAVILSEEIERLNEDGSPAGYEGAEADSSRASEMLDKIQNAILSAAP